MDTITQLIGIVCLIVAAVSFVLLINRKRKCCGSLHSSTPWQVCGPFRGDNDIFIGVIHNGELLNIASFECDETGRAQANAEFIVRAVNSHYNKLGNT